MSIDFTHRRTDGSLTNRAIVMCNGRLVQHLQGNRRRMFTTEHGMRSLTDSSDMSQRILLWSDNNLQLINTDFQWNMLGFLLRNARHVSLLDLSYCCIGTLTEERHAQLVEGVLHMKELGTLLLNGNALDLVESGSLIQSLARIAQLPSLRRIVLYENYLAPRTMQALRQCCPPSVELLAYQGSL